MGHFSFCSHICSQSLEKPRCLQCLMDEIAPEQAGLGVVSSQEGRSLREDRSSGGSSGGRVSRAVDQDMSLEQARLQLGVRGRLYRGEPCPGKSLEMGR